MSGAIIVHAWPLVLRPGLVVDTGGLTEGCAWADNTQILVAFGDEVCSVAWEDGGETTTEDDIPLAALRLNLRDDATRDAVLRAMWRKLRPEDPESLSAPQWIPHDDDATPAWSLARFDGDGDADAIYFAEYIGSTAPDGSMAVPELSGCYQEDADLLALGTCARAVLS